jgi:hypothetical protein
MLHPINILMKWFWCLLLLLGSLYLSWSLTPAQSQSKSPLIVWVQCASVLYQASDWVLEPTRSLWIHAAQALTEFMDHHVDPPTLAQVHVWRYLTESDLAIQMTQNTKVRMQLVRRAQECAQDVIPLITLQV